MKNKLRTQKILINSCLTLSVIIILSIIYYWITENKDVMMIVGLPCAVLLLCCMVAIQELKRRYGKTIMVVIPEDNFEEEIYWDNSSFPGVGDKIILSHFLISKNDQNKLKDLAGKSFVITEITWQRIQAQIYRQITLRKQNS